MAHKYLNQLGIKSDAPCIFNPVRRLNFKEWKQKRTHGFAMWQEIGSLDYTSATWLYEHIKLYREKAPEIIDFESDINPVFDIPVLHYIPESEREYTNDLKIYPKAVMREVIEPHGQLEAIDYIIKYLEYYFTEPDYPSDDIPWGGEREKSIGISEAKQYECLTCAFKIYAIIISSMWI